MKKDFEEGDLIHYRRRGFGGAYEDRFGIFVRYYGVGIWATWAYTIDDARRLYDLHLSGVKSHEGTSVVKQLVGNIPSLIEKAKPFDPKDCV